MVWSGSPWLCFASSRTTTPWLRRLSHRVMNDISIFRIMPCVIMANINFIVHKAMIVLPRCNTGTDAICYTITIRSGCRLWSVVSRSRLWGIISGCGLRSVSSSCGLPITCHTTQRTIRPEYTVPCMVTGCCVCPLTSRGSRSGFSTSWKCWWGLLCLQNNQQTGICFGKYSIQWKTHKGRRDSSM